MPEFADAETTEVERRLGPLKVVSLVECCTYLFLLFFWLSHNRVGTLMLGSMHGIVVCGFAGMVWLIYKQLRWTPAFAIFTVVTGPIGAIVLFVRVRREEPAIHAREQAALAERNARVAARTPPAAGSSGPMDPAPYHGGS